jgi:hypothetical protein
MATCAGPKGASISLWLAAASNVKVSFSLILSSALTSFPFDGPLTVEGGVRMASH